MKQLTPMIIARCLDTPLSAIMSTWPTVSTNLVALGMNAELIDIAALATIKIETSSFAPMVEEYSGNPYEYFSKYDYRKDLGNVYPGDGYLFRGRGLIQITGRYNYSHYSEETGLDLIKDPDLALNIIVAAKIFAYYFKEHDINIFACMEDWRKVRQLVNGALTDYVPFLGYINKLLEASS